MRRWLLIDGPNIIVKRWRAMEYGGDEVHEPAVARDVVRSIIKRGKRSFYHFAVALEGVQRCWRYDLYEDYKNAITDPRPPIAKRLQPYLGLACLRRNVAVRASVRGEADDVIATMKDKIRTNHPNDEVIIWTNDHDSYQLVDEKTKIFFRRKGDNNYVDCERVKEKYGVPPSSIPEMKAIMGDSSDGINGIDGIGPKRGAKMLEKANYNLNELLDNAKEYGLDQYEFNKEKIKKWHKLITLRRNEELFEPGMGYFSKSIKEQHEQD